MTLFVLLLLAQAPQASGPEPPANGEPEQVLNAEKAWAGADVLMPLLASSDVRVRTFALRAVGRLEDARLVPQLLALPAAPKGPPPGAVADAVAQSLKGFDPKNNPDLIASVADWMSAVGTHPDKETSFQVAGAIGRIAWLSPRQVRNAEAILVHVIGQTAQDPRYLGVYRSAMRSLASLARLNAGVAAFDGDTVKALARSLQGLSVNDSDDAVRLSALSALVAARAVDLDTGSAALKDASVEVRRVAVSVLGGASGDMDDRTRLARIEEALHDPSGLVRYEALRAYVRRGASINGCAPIVGALGDADSHVMLAALDALGDLCRQDEDITTRLMAEARTAPIAAWHRETHAFVALAKRAPGRVALSMDAFVTHPSWWVRMYAVRAAASAKDVVHLEKLAYDTSDNVREAALGPLRELKKAEADPAIVAALDRTDVQLVRTAATLLKESSRDERLFRPLMTALQRLTKEGKETSRDARVPLLEAIAIHAKPADAAEVQPLLRDFDPLVAAKAGEVVTALTGKAAVAEPAPRARGWPARFTNRDECVTVSMASGRSFRLRMDRRVAPITVDRFLTLATKDRYYDGLTIHRVVPNFVIQGGGPGANEYSGHKDYMRDEISSSSWNTRGTVGLSTRGRNTADAQFFVNLVDNARLDYDYTVFARVFDEDMPVVDAIEEGAVMTSVALLPRCGRR
jgi:cyclophilin family peptidyl-prolyl cis-trans isomerase/HEAT repeat protein